MTNFYSKNKLLLWVLLAAFLFYLIVVIVLQLFENANRPDYVANDALTYQEAAKFLYANFRVHPIRPIGFSFLIGLPYWLGIAAEYHPYWVFTLNIFCWFGVVVFVFRIISKIANSYFAFVGSLLFILNVGNIAITNQVLTESIFTFFLCVVAFLFLKYINTNSLKDLSWTIFVLCFSALIKPGIFYLILPAIIFFIYKSRFKLQSELKAHLVIFFGISILFLQMAMMKKQFGNFTLSYIDKITWYFYLGAEVETGGADSNYARLIETRRNEFDSISWGEQYDRSNKDLFQKIVSRPGDVWNGLIKNTRYNSSGLSNDILGAKNLNGSVFFECAKANFLELSYQENVYYNFALKWLIPILFLGLIIKRRFWRRINVYLLVIFGIAFYLFLVSGISFMQGDRFTIVYVPLVIICFCSLLYSHVKEENNEQNSI